MKRASLDDMLTGKESRYALVIGVAKRAREIAEAHVKEKEAAKAAAEKRAKMNGDQKIRLDDKTMRMVVLEENPVKTAVDEFAAGKYKLVEPDEDNDR